MSQNMFTWLSLCGVSLSILHDVHIHVTVVPGDSEKVYVII